MRASFNSMLRSDLSHAPKVKVFFYTVVFYSLIWSCFFRFSSQYCLLFILLAIFELHHEKEENQSAEYANVLCAHNSWLHNFCAIEFIDFFQSNTTVFRAQTIFRPNSIVVLQRISGLDEQKRWRNFLIKLNYNALPFSATITFFFVSRYLKTHTN